MNERSTVGRKWSRPLCAAVLGAALAAAAVPAAGASPLPDQQGGTRQEQGKLFGSRGEVHRHEHSRHGKAGSCFAMNQTHRRAYLLLLAQKYAPETTGEWKAVLDESDRLMAQVKERSGGKREGKRKDAQRPDAGSADRKERRERWQGAMRTFNDAVSSGDAAKIRGSLAELLTLTKARNEALKKKLAEAPRLS